MGYLFLAVAIFFGVAKGFFGKKTGNFVDSINTSILVSMIRLAFCVVLGAIMLMPQFLQDGICILRISSEVLWNTFISGIANAAILVLWLLIIRQGALVLIDIFGLIGALVPLIYSNFFFAEPLRINHWIGFVLLAFSVWLLCSYNNSVKPKITIKVAILLILFALVCGAGDLSQKIFVMQTNGSVSTSVFNFYTYIFACIFLGGYYLFIKLFLKRKAAGSEAASQNPISKKVLLYVVLMAACLYLNLLFKTVSANYMDAANIYPMYQGALMIANCIAAAIFFKERINYKSICGIILGIAALCMINLL